MLGETFIHEKAVVLGRVTIGPCSSVLPHAVLRGDLSTIDIGKYSNIQDNCVAHSDMGHLMRVGNFVTVGHGAVIHGTDIGDCCVVGMKSVLMNGSSVGRGSIVAAGTLVKENMAVPPFSLAVGNPAVIKENRYPDFLTPLESALIYYYLSRCYLRGSLPEEREIGKIYEAAKSGASMINEHLMKGDDISSILGTPLPLPF
jgi:carbonic anhydrase/acetyltransferase-like protein (isoleucine patch superfamily)